MSSPSESKHSMQLRSRGNMSKERSSEESEDSSSSAEFEEEIIPSPKKNQESTKPKDEELTEEFEDEELIEESEGEQPLEENEESESNQNVTKALNVTQQNNHEKDSKKTLYTALLIIASLVIGIGMKSSCFGTPEPSVDIDWRSKIDPKNHLSNEDQSMIRASLKPILDKSSSRQDESISTLLILSPNENTAAQIAQCLLALVNRQTNANQKSAEIDLRSYSGNKSNLDSELRSILDSTNPAKAVLLRGINHIPFEHLLERLRLLFGYCDGENPVITNRLFFLTANSTSENNLREYFKNKLPTEHDFVDALMARISGHTIYIESDQKSIC